MGHLMDNCIFIKHVSKNHGRIRMQPLWGRLLLVQKHSVALHVKENPIQLLTKSKANSKELTCVCTYVFVVEMDDVCSWGPAPGKAAWERVYFLLVMMLHTWGTYLLEINRGHPHPFLGEFNLSTAEDLLITSVCTATACYCLQKRCAMVHVLLQINMCLNILPSKCHWVFTLSRTVGGWFNGSERMTPAPFHLWRGVRLNHCGICWGW